MRFITSNRNLLFPQQIGCSEPEIAKTLSFVVDEKPVMVVMAGDGE